jgi:predicted branched-subunit amino acid permease
VLEESRRAVVRDSLGVGLAVGAYGVAFGAASVAAGLSVLQTGLLSLRAFTGGTQFAVVGVVSGGGTLATALGGGLQRFVAAQGTIDESTAMAVARRDPAHARVAFWWTFTAIYVCWNATTLAGAVGARALGDPAKFGLDAVVPRGRVNLRIAAGAALVALALIPVTPPGVPVLAAAAAVLLAGRLR